jgi:hypothetical protein
MSRIARHYPDQPDLWSQPLRVLQGEQAKATGCAKVAANNESYCDRFHAVAADILACQGQVTSDAVVAVAGMPEGHPSAIGAAMRSFAKSHKLSVAGYTKSTRKSCHAAIIAIWTR